MAYEQNGPASTGEQWSQHNRHIHNSPLPPSMPMQVALKYLSEQSFEAPGGLAADLGCGSGIDTLTLLNSGFSVLAVDKDAATIDLLRQSIPDDRLSTRVQSFETLSLPKVVWVNASFALPFCLPGSFDQCWQVIITALQPRGLFSGHMLGPRDSWTTRPDMNFQTRETIDALFAGFDIIWLNETDKEGRTVGGTPKHWHVFSIVAVRTASPGMQ